MYREMADYELINRYKAGERDFSDVTLLSRYQGMKPSLSGVDLVGINLSNARLVGASLSGNFDNASFEGADLQEAQLSGSFKEASFSRAKMPKAGLNGDFTGANFGSAYMESARMPSATLCKANLSHVQLNTAQLYDADLTGADLTEAMLAGAAVNRSIFHEAKLRGANLSATDMRDTEFDGADLTEAVFGKAKGIPSLRGAILDRTNFYDYVEISKDSYDFLFGEAASRNGMILPDGTTVGSASRVSSGAPAHVTAKAEGGKSQPSKTGPLLLFSIVGVVAGGIFGAVVTWAGPGLAEIFIPRWSGLARLAGEGALGGAAAAFVVSLFAIGGLVSKDGSGDGCNAVFAMLASIPGALVGAIPGAIVGVVCSGIKHIMYSDSTLSTGNWVLIGVGVGATLGLLVGIVSAQFGRD